jgi:hypothetical protein
MSHVCSGMACNEPHVLRCMLVELGRTSRVPMTDSMPILQQGNAWGFSRQPIGYPVGMQAKILARDHGEYVRAERDVLTSVRHPYIVMLNWSFQTSTKLYLVMDFVNGKARHHIETAKAYTQNL